MRMIVAALVVAFSSLASASSSTTDFTDLWWNPNESGWGVNVAQQRDTLFMTMFVYGPGSAPTWYVGSDVELVSTSNNTLTFSGILYRTTGPSFTLGSFNPGQVSIVPVGTITFSASQISAATLTYVIDGQSYAKSIQRQTWANENLSGTYVGASTGTWTSCGSARNGYAESYATYTVTHDGGTTFQMREDTGGGSCTYTGNYSQLGRMGQITGTGLCSDGVNQTFIATEVQASPQSLTMRFQTSQVGGCVFTGRLGGLLRAP